MVATTSLFAKEPLVCTKHTTPACEIQENWTVLSQVKVETFYELRVVNRTTSSTRHYFFVLQLRHSPT